MPFFSPFSAKISEKSLSTVLGFDSTTALGELLPSTILDDLAPPVSSSWLVPTTPGVSMEPLEPLAIGPPVKSGF